MFENMAPGGNCNVTWCHICKAKAKQSDFVLQFPPEDVFPNIINKMCLVCVYLTLAMFENMAAGDNCNIKGCPICHICQASAKSADYVLQFPPEGVFPNITNKMCLVCIYLTLAMFENMALGGNCNIQCCHICKASASKQILCYN